MKVPGEVSWDMDRGQFYVNFGGERSLYMPKEEVGKLLTDAGAVVKDGRKWHNSLLSLLTKGGVVRVFMDKEAVDSIKGETEGRLIEVLMEELD